MEPDPLWTPLIGHYGDDGLDAGRIRAHVAHLTPHVRQYLIGGTTGDGWALDESLLRQWLDLLADTYAFDARHRVLIGAFGTTTEAVITRALLIEQCIRASPTAANFAGLAVCPPVDPNASQEAIAGHLEAVLAATSSPLAVYQLPQVTGCEIAPGTFSRLAGRHHRIRYFKDTSGEDRVAWSGLPLNGVCLVRGAEGKYAQQLKPAGPYHGWLLSTGNGFATELRAIANRVSEGWNDEALALSDRLSALVAELFALAAAPGGNAFADSNRAVDHVQAYGSSWRSVPAPRRIDGSSLGLDFLAEVERALIATGIQLARYLR